MIKTNKWKNTNGTDEPNWDKWILAVIFIAIIYGLNSGNTKNENPPKPQTRINKLPSTHLRLNMLHNVKSKSSATVSRALLSACKYGYLDIVKLALENGADINIHGKNNATPLYIAMENKRRKIVSELLKHKPNLQAKTKHGYTILHCASKYNYVEVAQKCLVAKVDIDALANRIEWTALHYAARYGHKNIIALLKESGANTKLRIAFGHLASALVFQKFPGVASYIERPLNKYLLLPGEYLFSEQFTPNKAYLFNAIKNNQISIIQNAIKENKISLEASDTYGRTLLANALQHKKPLIVGLLASNNANLFATDMFLNSILHWAVLRSNQWLVKNIIINNENINLQNIRGDTPLHIAVKSNNVQATKFLLENGANPSITNSKDISVFDMFDNSSKEIQTLLTNMAEVAPSKALKTNNAEVEIKYTGNK